MITVQNLTYTYPTATAETLHGLNFEIAEREIFGFLGPSGAGKSTTQKILIGLLQKYGGTITVMGRELTEWGQEYYEHIGVSFELPNHYLKLTALENLAYFRSLYSGDTLDPMEVLTWVGLEDDAEKKVSDFSKGMKIRMNVARSLLHKPKILFLDEPTSGLDSDARSKFEDAVDQWFENPSIDSKAFIWSSHDADQLARLSNRQISMNRGKLEMSLES